MFVAPPEKEVEWSDAGLEGSFRFLVRVWRIGRSLGRDDRRRRDPGLRRRLHRRRAGAAPEDARDDPARDGRHRGADAPQHGRVVADGAGQRAVCVQRGDRARWADAGSRRSGGVERPQTIAVLREAVDALVVMISPFAPHTAEELWHMLGHAEGLAKATWPSFDAAVAKADEVVVPVQINGKVRARLTVPAGASDDELRELALADAVVRTHTMGKTIRKVVVAKGPLVSVVVSCGRPMKLEGWLGGAPVVCPLRGHWSAGAGYALAGPWVVPAQLHQDDRRPDVQQPFECVQSGDAADAESPRRVHRPRQVSRSSRRRPNVDAVLTGEIIFGQARRLQPGRPAAGRPLLRDQSPRASRCATCARNKVIWENPRA